MNSTILRIAIYTVGAALMTYVFLYYLVARLRYPAQDPRGNIFKLSVVQESIFVSILVALYALLSWVANTLGRLELYIGFSVGLVYVGVILGLFYFRYLDQRYGRLGGNPSKMKIGKISLTPVIIGLGILLVILAQVGAALNLSDTYWYIVQAVFLMILFISLFFIRRARIKGNQ
jgi:hypothetical protein